MINNKNINIFKNIVLRMFLLAIFAGAGAAKRNQAAPQSQQASPKKGGISPQAFERAERAEAERAVPARGEEVGQQGAGAQSAASEEIFPSLASRNNSPSQPGSGSPRKELTQVEVEALFGTPSATDQAIAKVAAAVNANSYLSGYSENSSEPSPKGERARAQRSKQLEIAATSAEEVGRQGAVYDSEKQAEENPGAAQDVVLSGTPPATDQAIAISSPVAANANSSQSGGSENPADHPVTAAAISSPAATPASAEEAAQSGDGFWSCHSTPESHPLAATHSGELTGVAKKYLTSAEEVGRQGAVYDSEKQAEKNPEAAQDVVFFGTPPAIDQAIATSSPAPAVNDSYSEDLPPAATDDREDPASAIPLHRRPKAKDPAATAAPGAPVPGAKEEAALDRAKLGPSPAATAKAAADKAAADKAATAKAAAAKAATAKAAAAKAAAAKAAAAKAAAAKAAADKAAKEKADKAWPKKINGAVMFLMDLSEISGVDHLGGVAQLVFNAKDSKNFSFTLGFNYNLNQLIGFPITVLVGGAFQNNQVAKGFAQITYVFFDVLHLGVLIKCRTTIEYGVIVAIDVFACEKFFQ